MNYRNLGKSGLKVSELSFGSWVTYGNQVDLELAKKLMSAAWDHGVNFFDNGQGAQGTRLAKGAICGLYQDLLGWANPHRTGFVL